MPVNEGLSSAPDGGDARRTRGSRSALTRTLGVLGLSAAMIIAYDGSDAVRTSNARASVEAEQRPETLMKVHQMLAGKYKADEIAQSVASMDPSQKDYPNTEGLIDPQLLVINGHQYTIALASAEDGSYHYAVGGRGSEMSLNPYLLGVSEESQEQALMNAADDLREMYASGDLDQATQVALSDQRLAYGDVLEPSR